MNETESTPVRKFLLFLRAGSPIKQEGSMLQAEFACPKCRAPGRIQTCNGGALLQSVAQLRELFERIGTQISIATKDVLAGAKIKDLGDLIVDWCEEAEIGDVRDVQEIQVTLTRLKDDTNAVADIALKPEPKLVLAGGNC
jgi:hypothetical protein